MKKIKYLLKAVVIIGIVLAFIMPVAAMTEKENPVTIQAPTVKSLLKTMISTMNPGWEEQASGFWEPSRGINFIYAVDENIVWAAGYDGSGASQPVQEFTKTINGGTLWEADAMFGAPTDGELAMICGVDADHAWVPLHSGNPQGIWATSDGGDTWTQQTTALFSGAGAFPNVVHFWNVNDGWCQGDPVDGYYEMYTTTDGGTTWTRVPTENIPAPLPNEWGTVGYYDVVGDTVWFGTQNVGLPGRIFKSTDRGLTWTVADTPFPSGGWVDVRMKDLDNGLAMDKRSTASYLAETSDGGATWIEITPTGPFYGNDIAFVPGTTNTWISTGAASGASGASYSLDGGHTWTDFSEVNGVQLMDSDFVDGGIGWAGSFNDDEFTGGVYKYTPESAAAICCDGSISWTDVEPGATVTDTFEVSNCGDPGSLLDWAVASDPGFGIWTFSPNSGTDLAEGDSVTVTATCEAPDEPETEFTGVITVANSNNPTDSCEVPVVLQTPLNNQQNSQQNLFQMFFQILQQILNIW